MKNETYLDLFLEMSLRHLYEAEKIMKENLITLSNIAISPQLKVICHQHIVETHLQIERLERVFYLLGIDKSQDRLEVSEKKTAEKRKAHSVIVPITSPSGMSGIIAEGEKDLRKLVDTDVCDFAIIAIARKVENYEIGCYQTILTLLNHYEEKEASHLLQFSLKEEKHADVLLDEASKDNLVRHYYYS